jgi:uncharacterized protein with HEPN domain
MAHSPEKLLADILAACSAISAFTLGRTRDEYAADLMLRSAVERQLEILGEAIRRLGALDPERVARISEHRRIIAMRNIIAHGYDGLDNDVVWQAVGEKIVIVQREAGTMLNELDPEADIG